MQRHAASGILSKAWESLVTSVWRLKCLMVDKSALSQNWTMHRSSSAGAGDMLDALGIMFPIPDEHSVVIVYSHLVDRNSFPPRKIYFCSGALQQRGEVKHKISAELFSWFSAEHLFFVIYFKNELHQINICTSMLMKMQTCSISPSIFIHE